MSRGETDWYYSGVLEQAELLLTEVAAERNLPLAVRWWFHLGNILSRSIPRTAADVWQEIKNPDNARVHQLQIEGVPPQTCLGFLLTIDAQKLREEQEYLRQLCEALLAPQLFSVSVAIVIEVHGESIDEARLAVCALPDWRLSKPVEKLLSEDYFVVATNQYAQEEMLNPLEAPEKSPGAYLYAWLDAIGRKGCKELHNYPMLRDAWGHLCKAEKEKARQRGEGFRQLLPAPERVIADLDELAADGDKEIGRQFLELVQVYLPERLVEVIKVYPLSKRISTRLAALVFARQSSLLMDAWVDTALADLTRLPQNSDFVSLGRDRSVLSDLILALLRQPHHHSSRNNLIDWITGYWNVLPIELKMVCEFCLGKISEDLLLEKLRAGMGSAYETLKMAVSAKAPLIRSVVALKSLTFDEPEFWNAIAALPPERERLRALLELDLPRRAVFGLWTEQEWAELRHQVNVIEQVNRCRSARPLG